MTCLAFLLLPGLTLGTPQNAPKGIDQSLAGVSDATVAVARPHRISYTPPFFYPSVSYLLQDLPALDWANCVYPDS